MDVNCLLINSKRETSKNGSPGLSKLTSFDVYHRKKGKSLKIMMISHHKRMEDFVPDLAPGRTWLGPRKSARRGWELLRYPYIFNIPKHRFLRGGVRYVAYDHPLTFWGSKTRFLALFGTPENTLFGTFPGPPKTPKMTPPRRLPETPKGPQNRGY